MSPQEAATYARKSLKWVYRQKAQPFCRPIGTRGFLVSRAGLDAFIRGERG